MTGKITGALREQSDWEQNDEHRLGFIKNKPFYDARKTAPLTIEWDGEIGGREHITYPLNNQLLVKVSSIILTKAELETGEVTAVNPLIGEAETIPVTSASINESENGVIYVLDGAILSIPTEVSVEVNGTVLKCTPGLWFKRMTTEVGGMATDVYITKLSLPSVTTGELKTIDPKYYRKTFNLNAYNGKGKETDDTVSIAMAIAALTASGGGSCVLSGEDITRFCNEIRNCNTDISVLVPLENAVYELHPTFVGKEGKTALGFNIAHVSGDPTHSFTIAFALFCLTESLQVYVVIR